MNYYLAIDIGASSGRHMLGWIENGTICYEEIYRFENYIEKKDGVLVWDIDHLVGEVKNGIRKCHEIKKYPKTIAIDTWGVDYVLLDENKEVLMPCISYRDGRTASAVAAVEEIVSAEELYQRTGVQKQNFNTIYQLYCDQKSGKLEKAHYFMMMPAYLSYCLTGVAANEYTDATTGALVNTQTKDWDMELIGRLGYPERLFPPLKTPGDSIGHFSDAMKEFAGFDAEVVFCPSHDTASAVAACNMGENDLYISSGTWSLIGMETKTPILTQSAADANFANEGGIEYRFRFLKNYMGMWLFQNIRKNIDKSKTYDEMMKLAMACPEHEKIDVNAPAFVAPENMIQAIRDYVKKPNMPLDAVLNTVYHSLAMSYRDAVQEIEKITGKEILAIHIIGGGCRDAYLNTLTAQYCGKEVTAGPVEATATGNLISQMIAAGECADLQAARALVKR